MAFQFRRVAHPDGAVVLLEIPIANIAPVSFDDIAYVRIGSTTPKLTDYPERQQKLMDYINGLLLLNEHIGAVFREDHPLYPERAIRELIANALIHQDMTITAGPQVALFKGRMESNREGDGMLSTRGASMAGWK